MRPRHPKKDIEKALATVEESGWTITLRSGHAWGVMKCAGGCCQVSIWSTPKSEGNHAKQLLRELKKCPGNSHASGDSDRPEDANED